LAQAGPVGQTSAFCGGLSGDACPLWVGL